MIVWPAAVALVLAVAPPAGAGACDEPDPDGRRREALCALRQREDVQVAVSKERLQQILDRAEFSGARDRPSDAFARLMRQLEALWEALLGRREVESFSEWTRLAVMALAVAVLVGGALRITRGRGRRRPVGEGDSGAEAGALVLEDPDVHLAHARSAARSGGNPREAIRQALLALLSLLERRRWARPDRVRTNRELAAELPSRGAPPEITHEVDRLVRWYDRAYYSLDPVAAGEAEQFLDEVTRFEARLSGGGPA